MQQACKAAWQQAEQCTTLCNLTELAFLKRSWKCDAMNMSLTRFSLTQALADKTDLTPLLSNTAFLGIVLVWQKCRRVQP